ncbi:MAG: hypothetical protein RMJ46_01285, partial [Bacteroidota bacterium]|nr:hypothetical protein [Bacteroidota bacterium]
LLPQVPVPEDFEEQLWLRRALHELPTVPVPETFEKELWKRIHVERRKAFVRRGAFLVIAFVVLLGGGIGLWYLHRPPSPLVAPPLRQLEQIEPLTVSIDQRFFVISPRQHHAHPTPSTQLRSPIPGGDVPLPPPEE